MSTDDGRGGLRERKRRETRWALSWAAVRLVVENGLANVTAEAVAAEAGYSHRTFNNYFGSIPEAIAARHQDRAVLIGDLLRARPPEEPLWEAIANAAVEQLEQDPVSAGDRVPDPEWPSGLRLMMAEPALQGEFLKAHAAAEAALAAAVAERTGTVVGRDLYPRLVAAVAGGAMRAAMDRYAEADPPVSFAQLLRDALAQVATGLPQP